CYPSLLGDHCCRPPRKSSFLTSRQTVLDRKPLPPDSFRQTTNKHLKLFYSFRYNLITSNYISSTDRIFPAGSLNQATFGPPPLLLHTPFPSVSISPSYCSKRTPLRTSSSTASSMLPTGKLMVVNVARSWFAFR